jgi:structural maintenance of chromosomes protein 5
VIEIELHDPSQPDQKLIFKRIFEKGSNSSKWSINGETATEGTVKKHVAKLNIQVDNLCQFLPQDKVAGFAQMDAPRLLRETERAAGLRLLEQHDQLIGLQKELKSLESVILLY